MARARQHGPTSAAMNCTLAASTRSSPARTISPVLAGIIAASGTPPRCRVLYQPFIAGRNNRRPTAVEERVFLARRLGDGVYDTMDQVCAQALALFEKPIVRLAAGIRLAAGQPERDWAALPA